MIKQNCPRCKTIVELNEKEFEPDEHVVRHCPLCDERIVFVIPPKDKRVEEENDALKKELEALKQQISGLKDDLTQQTQINDRLNMGMDNNRMPRTNRPPQPMGNRPPQNNMRNRPRPTSPAPDNHLVAAIMVTIFCCLPLGIPAILNAAKVDKLWAQGDIMGAENAAEDAKKYVKLSVICGIIAIALYFILLFISMLAEM